MNRVVVVLLQGNDRLDLLFPHIAAQKPAFSELQLWMNTLDASVYARAKSVCDNVPWARIISSTVPIDTQNSQYRFYVTSGSREDAVYLQLNESVVWLHATFIHDMFAARESELTKDVRWLHGNAINHPSAGVSPAFLQTEPADADTDRARAQASIATHTNYLSVIESAEATAHLLSNLQAIDMTAVPGTTFPCAQSWKGAYIDAFKPMNVEVITESAHAVVPWVVCSFLCVPRQRFWVARSGIVEKYDTLVPLIKL